MKRKSLNPNKASCKSWLASTIWFSSKKQPDSIRLRVRFMERADTTFMPCIGTMNRSEFPSPGLRPPSSPPRAVEREARGKPTRFRDRALGPWMSNERGTASNAAEPRLAPLEHARLRDVGRQHARVFAGVDDAV